MSNNLPFLPRPDEIRLACGEMSPNEMRLVLAVLNWFNNTAVRAALAAQPVAQAPEQAAVVPSVSLRKDASGVVWVHFAAKDGGKAMLALTNIVNDRLERSRTFSNKIMLAALDEFPEASKPVQAESSIDHWQQKGFLGDPQEWREACRLYRSRCNEQDVAAMAKLHAYLEDGLLEVRRPTEDHGKPEQALQAANILQDLGWTFANGRWMEDKAATETLALQAGGGEPVMIYHGRHTIDCGEFGSHDVEMLKMIPAGTLLYTRPYVQSELDAAEARAKQIVAGFNIEGAPPVQQADTPTCQHEYTYFGDQQKRRRCNLCNELEPVQANAPSGVGEQETFEVWAEPITALAKKDGNYIEAMTALAWEAWQARAALSAQPQADNWRKYAKEGETAQACIERHRKEQDGLLKLLKEARSTQPQEVQKP